jgi:hypothetical protein
VLGSFIKKRKKPIGIFTENTVVLFNKFVDEIDNHISFYLKRMHEVELNRAGLLDFGDFFDINMMWMAMVKFILMFIQSLKKELMIKEKR